MDSRALREMDDVQRIRIEIKHAARYTAGDPVQIKCVNKADADAIAAKLTEDEMVSVRFTWLIK